LIFRNDTVSAITKKGNDWSVYSTSILASSGQRYPSIIKCTRDD